MSKKKNDELNEFAFTRKNYKLLIIGFAVVVLGFILMAGGGTDDPNVFPEEQLFSFRRITLAPLVCLAGYVIVMIAIMKKPKREE